MDKTISKAPSRTVVDDLEANRLHCFVP